MLRHCDVKSGVLEVLSLLIEVLPGSMEVSNEVKFSIKCCFPKKLESFFGFRILCDLKRLLVLGISHVSQLLVVRVPHQQKVYNDSVSVVCRVVQGSPGSEV